MVVTLEDAFTILKKWRDESAPILIVAECPFRQHFRGIHESGVDWSMGLRGKVSHVTFSPGAIGPKTGIVVFDGASGNLSMSVGGCAFVYEEPHEAQPVVRGEAEFTFLRRRSTTPSPMPIPALGPFAPREDTTCDAFPRMPTHQ